MVTDNGGFVVLGDVGFALRIGPGTRLADAVDAEIMADVRHLNGCKTLAVRASALAAVVVAFPNPAVSAFLAWARTDLFPLILGGVSMDDVEAILRSPFEKESSFVGTMISYEDGAPGAVLTEDPVTRRLWGTALQIAAVLGTRVKNVEKHLKAIFSEGFLESIRTTHSQWVVRIENGRRVRREVIFYDFEAILAVGDRVSTSKVAAFRRWRARLVEAHLIGLAGVEIENASFAGSEPRSRTTARSRRRRHRLCRAVSGGRRDDRAGDLDHRREREFGVRPGGA